MSNLIARSRSDNETLDDILGPEPQPVVETLDDILGPQTRHLSVSQWERQIGRLFAGHQLSHSGHNQGYQTLTSYGHASDGSIGWIVSIYFRSGKRSFGIAETIGSKANTGAIPTDERLRILPNRRAHRHARILGISTK